MGGAEGVDSEEDGDVKGLMAYGSDGWLKDTTDGLYGGGGVGSKASYGWFLCDVVILELTAYGREVMFDGFPLGFVSDEYNSKELSSPTR